jgi:pimeloyl-ACP methyl ester carboxylesterase
MIGSTNGYVPVNGVDVYWEGRGAGGTPLVVVHGGFGVTRMFADLLERLSADRQVIAIELQGHGHTRDTPRPFTYEAFGDDIAGVIDGLGLGPVDLLGNSLGATASLRAAIQHPDSMRRLIVVSIPFRRDGWFPEVLAGMDQIGSAGFEMMKQSPMYDAWSAVAPDIDAFPRLMDKTGALLRRPFDWSEEVKQLAVPTLLVYGDADSIPPSHAAEFFGLLGGGSRDAGWDGSLPTHNRLAILPGLTHYNIFNTPQVAAVVAEFTAGG